MKYGVLEQAIQTHRTSDMRSLWVSWDEMRASQECMLYVFDTAGQ